MNRKSLFAIALFMCIGLTTFAQQFKVLLVTRTVGWHHESIRDGVDAMYQLAATHDFKMHWDENVGRVFTEDFIKDYDVIVFLNTTGDVLNNEQQEVMKKFIQSGKGFVGIHAASDTEYDWLWYNKLVGRMFKIHPAVQTAMVDVTDTNFPGMETFPKRFMWTDEWYQWKPEKYSTDIKVLLTLDESSYDPNVKWGDNVGGPIGNHPLAWYQNYDGGRSFYTALGHVPGVYDNEWFLHHLYGGIYWAATGKGIKK